MTQSFRGNKITLVNGAYLYCDTLKPTADTWLARPCGKCGLPFDENGHDACLGRLHGVMNACCGHGVTRDAYMQLDGGHRLSGADALEAFKSLKNEGPT